MSFNEKPVLGAHVINNVDPHPTSTTLLPPGLAVDNTSSSSLTPTCEQGLTPTEEYHHSSSHPFSAFYLHPTTRTSLEQNRSESKIHIRVHEQDLEAASSNFPSSEASRSNKECQVWPSKQQMDKKFRMMEKRNGCSPLRRLNKKQQIWAKILIALVVVGAAVGIGIGISRAVGGGVWKDENSQGRIGSGS